MSKELIKKLFDIASKQQKIIHKLAVAIEQVPQDHFKEQREDILTYLKLNGIYPNYVNEINVVSETVVGAVLTPGVEYSKELDEDVQTAVEHTLPNARVTFKPSN